LTTVLFIVHSRKCRLGNIE